VGRSRRGQSSVAPGFSNWLYRLWLHAEHHGFRGGGTATDWQAAEAETDAAFNKGEDASIHWHVIRA